MAEGDDQLLAALGVTAEAQDQVEKAVIDQVGENASMGIRAARQELP